MPSVDGELLNGRVRGFKGTPPKYNSKGELTAEPLLLVTLELPNDPELARKLAKLTREGGAVSVALEKRQRELALDADGELRLER